MTIRVRFAPSPTGYLHIGNARAALINWLFARHAKLKGESAEFILRIDDTDLERSEQRYTDAIYADMAWLGLHHDLTFHQSHRFDRYHEVMQQLIAMGRLYPCYETPEELDFKRKRQMGRGQPPIYDRAALKLNDEQKQNFEAEGRKPHWRFLLTDEDVVWEDLIRGRVEFHGNRLSDPVLVRGDGAFLYTITSVIDDIDYKISHIIRGEDHVTNTAVQLQLFSALGCNPDTLHFAHTTLLMDAQGGPLSKRLGSLSLGNLRDMGIEPMAIASLLARLGTSLSVEPFLDLDTLAKTCDLGSFSRTAPHFDQHDLETLNHKLFQITPYEHIAARLQDIAPKITPELWDLVRGNIKVLSDSSIWQEVCFGDKDGQITDPDYIAIAKSLLPVAPWDQTTWPTWAGLIKEKTGRKGKELFMPLRQAITGFDHGPEMKDLLPIIGYESVLKRLG